MIGWVIVLTINLPILIRFDDYVGDVFGRRSEENTHDNPRDQLIMKLWPVSIILDILLFYYGLS